jgi:hypothetical protein
MSKNGGLQIPVKMDLNEKIIVLNTKQKDLGRSRLSLIYGNWLKLEKLIFYPFTANFFQTENTKCIIFEQNRLIACQTQEETKKICWFGKL